jgi:hypothetical protein
MGGGAVIASLGAIFAQATSRKKWKYVLPGLVLWGIPASIAIVNDAARLLQ